MADKLAAANKLEAHLKALGYDGLKEIAGELRALGSYEAAVDSAKRELKDLQALQAKTRDDVRVSATKLDKRLAEIEDVQHKAEEAAQTAKSDADAYVAQKHEEANAELAGAKAERGQIVSDARLEAEALKTKIEDKLAAAIASTTTAEAALADVEREIAKRQQVLDNINALLAKHMGVDFEKPAAAPSPS